MKKGIFIKFVTMAFVSTSSFAVGYEDVQSVTLEKINCSNGPEGFKVIVKYLDNKNDTIMNSCEKNSVTPDKNPNINLEADANVQDIILNTPTRATQTVTRYYTLPNGYTKPNIEANNSCNGGFQDIFAWGRTSCYFNEGSTSIDSKGGLKEGWLNLITLSDYHTLSGLGLKNIDNLKNLHIINNGNLSITNTSIQNVNGLINLAGHSNQNSSSFNGTTWGSDRISLYSSHRGLDLRNNKELKDINGLINYRSSDWVDLTGNDKLTDISGLANLKLRGSYAVYFDDKSYTKKLPSYSWLCQNPTKLKVKSTSTSPSSSNNSAYTISYSKVCE